MNNKMKKTIKMAIVFTMVATMILFLIVSQDEHHLEKCEEENCIICTLIHVAQNIIGLSIAFIVTIEIGVLIYFFLSRLRKEKSFFVQSSLVFQKVQFNE